MLVNWKVLESYGERRREGGRGRGRLPQPWGGSLFRFPSSLGKVFRYTIPSWPGLAGDTAMEIIVSRWLKRGRPLLDWEGGEICSCNAHFHLFIGLFIQQVFMEHLLCDMYVSAFFTSWCLVAFLYHPKADSTHSFLGLWTLEVVWLSFGIRSYPKT